MPNEGPQPLSRFRFYNPFWDATQEKEDTSFGPRLAAIRQARGVTQVQLAEATGSTQRSISYIAAPRKNGPQGERHGR